MKHILCISAMLVLTLSVVAIRADKSDCGKVKSLFKSAGCTITKGAIDFGDSFRDGIRKIKNEAHVVYVKLDLVKKTKKLDAELDQGMETLTDEDTRDNLVQKAKELDGNVQEGFNVLKEEAKDEYDKRNGTEKTEAFNRDVRVGLAKVKAEVTDVNDKIDIDEKTKVLDVKLRAGFQVYMNKVTEALRKKFREKPKPPKPIGRTCRRVVIDSVPFPKMKMTTYGDKSLMDVTTENVLREMTTPVNKSLMDVTTENIDPTQPLEESQTTEFNTEANK